MAGRKTTKAKKATGKVTRKKASKKADAPALTNQKLTAEQEATLKAFEEETAASQSGPKVPFLKLSNKRNNIRILPGSTSVAPFFKVRMHRVKSGKRFSTPMDLDFVFADTEFAKKVISTYNKLTKKDWELVKKYGDPLTMLPRRLMDLGRKDDAQGLWAGTRYLWNVVDRKDGKVYLWESSKSMYTAIAGLVQVYPNMFDPEKGRDITINGNGEDGLKRRYGAPIIAPHESEVEVGEDETVFDLEEVASRKVVTFEKKAVALFANYADLARSVGITPETFSELSLSSVESVKEKDDEDWEDED